MEDQIVCVEAEVFRMTGAEKLETHFHEFFGGELRAWESLDYRRAVFFKELLTLPDAFYVCVLELEPKVGFQSRES